MLPPGAIAFIGGAAGFCLLLLIFFLYITKKACFSGAKGCACCADEVKGNQLESESESDDSEDEIKDIYRKSMRRKKEKKTRNGYSPVPSDDPEAGSHYGAVSTKPSSTVVSTPKAASNSNRAASRTSVNTILRPASAAASAAPSAAARSEGSRGPPIAAAAATRSSGDVSVAAAVSALSLTSPKTVVESGNLSGRGSPTIAIEEADVAAAQISDALALDSPRELSGDEFDVSDLNPEEESKIVSKCGNLLVQFTYVVEGNNGTMAVTIHQGRDIPDKSRGGAPSCQVHVVLLPTKQQRHKTKSQPSSDPNFEETFTFKGVPPQDVNNMGIRLRIYGKESMRRERLIGECIVTFASLNLDNESSSLWITMEPRMNLAGADNRGDADVSDGSEFGAAISQGVMPELYVGLAYSGTTGRLSVEIIKGSHFKSFGQTRAPDTYVKCSLMSSEGSPIAHSKTSVRRGQPNPLFKETFMFQVALFQLPEISLMVSVYSKKSMKIKKKQMIGWFSMGYNSSGEEEKAHWEDMITTNGEEVARWHVLLEN